MGLALGLGLVALAGCSNDPYPPGETAQSVIYRTLTDEPRTLDPNAAYVQTEGMLIDPIYPAYFQYHYLKRPFKLILALGATQPERQPYTFTTQVKGKTAQKRGESWTFHIKHGLRFQDDPCFPDGKGREIKAADFIYSFRRMADPDASTIPCPVLSFFQDKIIGLDDYVNQNQAAQAKHQKADYNAPVAGLQLDPQDPYTFRILLNQPYPQLRYLMAMHFTTPMAHEAVERYGKELRKHPVGCGAYMMTEYIPKQRIVEEANPNRFKEYYPRDGEAGDREAGLLKDAGKQLPLANKVVYNFIKEDITGWNLFLQGYMDSWSVTQENYQQVISRPGELSPEMQRKGVVLRKVVVPNIDYFAFNMDDPVVGGYAPKQRKLRQAISLAINAQDYIDLFSEGNGKVAQFLIPPGLFGYDANYRNPYRQYDPKLTRAKELLKEAGYPNGIDAKTGERLTIFYDNAATNAAGRQEVGLTTRQIEALGIHLQSNTSRDIIWQDRIDKGQFQFMAYGWLADYPDPENFMFLLYGPNKRPGVNSANYNNPAYNRLFEQMRAMDDGPARLALIKQMRAIAVEDCPWVFRVHNENLGLSYDWLTNGKTHPVANDTIKYRGVDGPLRAREQALWNQPEYWPLAVGLVLIGLMSLPAISTVRQRRGRRVRRETAVSTGPKPPEVRA